MRRKTYVLVVALVGQTDDANPQVFSVARGGVRAWAELHGIGPEEYAVFDGELLKGFNNKRHYDG